MKNNINHLPSKKFIYSVSLILGCGIIIFIVMNLFSSKNSFFASKKDAKLETESLTLNQLVQKDSDGDGVTDWEESLWGTDPNKKSTFDDIPDANYIGNKRLELKMGTNIDNSKLTETEKFAREFFASYSALKTSGGTDNSSTVSNFSNALSQRVTENPIVDKYSEKDVKLTKQDETTDQENYYITAGNLFEKYKKEGIGDELEVAGNMASIGKKEDYQNQDSLKKISSAYQGYAQELFLVPVPKSLATYHLKIINSANNTSIAILNMSKMITDPIVGISGISQYKKYNEDFINSVQELETFLTNSGIISE